MCVPSMLSPKIQAADLILGRLIRSSIRPVGGGEGCEAERVEVKCERMRAFRAHRALVNRATLREDKDASRRCALRSPSASIIVGLLAPGGNPLI